MHRTFLSTRAAAPTPGARRSGTVLIFVAGLSALLASMCLVFLTRMRNDGEESQLVLQMAQAKILLAAACNYVQETSRLGWDANYPYYGQPPAHPVGTSSVVSVPNGTGVLSLAGAVVAAPNPATLPAHQETFGWIDVRDGSIGPNFRGPSPQTPPYPPAWSDAAVISDGHGNSRPAWPAIGSVAICPMYVMKRPPFATQLTAVYNPISTTSGDPKFGLPYLQYPDPMPVVGNGWGQRATSGAVAATLYDDGVGGTTGNDFVHGDQTPRAQTAGKSWFRVYRDGPATFVLTCGAGGTMGWRDWPEVVNAGGAAAMAQFNNDPTLFTALAGSELRLWYRIEWSPSVMELTYHNLQHSAQAGVEHYLSWPANVSHTWSVGLRTQTWAKNPVGTIRWIERLRNEPSIY